MKMRYHVYEKKAVPTFSGVVYDSEPLDPDTARIEGDRKRQEYGPQYDIFFTVEASK